MSVRVFLAGFLMGSIITPMVLVFSVLVSGSSLNICPELPGAPFKLMLAPSAKRQRCSPR